MFWSRSWHHQLVLTVTSSALPLFSGLGAALRARVRGGIAKVWAALQFLRCVFLPLWTGKCSVRGCSLVASAVVNLF